jgi:hypothetical protein
MGSISKRFCGFCGCKRNVYTKVHVGWTDVLSCAVLAFLLVLIFWQTPDPRGFLLFACLLGVFEFAIQIRWRLSVSCQYCGFDPLLYKRSRPKAAEKVKEHLDRRRADPNHVLSTQPFVNLRKRAERRALIDPN